MNNLDNFCLYSNAFDTNIREHFRKLRKDPRLFDVTLATEDGKHIQAHKIILSAGSNFFSDIFLKTNQTDLDMLIYLKGIHSDKLESILDFIYEGEILITQGTLKIFIETAKELQVKGIEDELTGIRENMDDTENNYHNKSQTLYNNKNSEEEQVTDTTDTNEGKTDVRIKKENMTQRNNDELSHQIKKMVEKYGGIWKCRVCGKTSPSNRHGDIIRHAERHIEGMSYSCHICNRTLPNRHNLSNHISNIHSELFTCDICEKSGMNRKAFINHKWRQHTLSNRLCYAKLP